MNQRLRSEAWFNDLSNPGMTAIYLERYFNYGMTLEELRAGRPIIGIAQSANDLAPCNRAHLHTVERLRDGVRDAGSGQARSTKTVFFNSLLPPLRALGIAMSWERRCR